MKILFAGTPDFAARHLEALLNSHHQVIGVYTQPDRPAGRGKKLSPSPVKELALAHGIPVYQPASLKPAEAQAELASLGADIMVVVAYGLILPKPVLEAPRLGCINVHASLLPRWRGAAPIQRAIEAGDTETGITIMQMDVGLDTGDMLIKTKCPILPTDTGGSLHDRLLTLGGPALLEALDELEQGRTRPQAQDDNQSNYAPKLSKDEAALDWRLRADVLARRVRAFNPFPMAHTKLAGADDSERYRIWMAEALSQTRVAPVGQIVQVDEKGIVVACAEGQLAITQIQLPGKKAMLVKELLRGHPTLFAPGQQLDTPSC